VSPSSPTSLCNETGRAERVKMLKRVSEAQGERTIGAGIGRDGDQATATRHGCGGRQQPSARAIEPRVAISPSAATKSRPSSSTTVAASRPDRRLRLLARQRRRPGRGRMSVAGDKSYGARDFVAWARAPGATPHVARKKHGSAIDGRTSRHGYAASQWRRKLIEESYGWMASAGCASCVTAARPR
jgi:hypothetical protein